MTVLKPAPVSTRQLRWDREARTFTADASDLNGFGRVWNDSADTGFTLVSHMTGQEAVVVMTDEKIDREGDILWWDFAPISRDHQFTVRIFND